MAIDQPDEEDKRIFLLRLKHELLLLALPGMRQLEIFRDTPLHCVGNRSPEEAKLVLEAVAAEEFALDFDHWKSIVLGHIGERLTVRQRACLNAVDAYFEAMGGQENERLWSPMAVLQAPEWTDIRSLASLALSAFGWDVETPRNYGRALADFAWHDELPEIPTHEAIR